MWSGYSTKCEKRAEASTRDDAFEMYQTHGFPPEWLENMAAERNLLFDWEGYRRTMEEHQEESDQKTRWKSSDRARANPGQGRRGDVVCRL